MAADRFPTEPLIAEIDLRLRQMVSRSHYGGCRVYGQRQIATRDAHERQVAEQVGVHQRTIRRLRDRETLTEVEADTWAVRLGRHPGELWPSWWDGLDEALAAEEALVRPRTHCRKGHRVSGPGRCPACKSQQNAMDWQRRKARLKAAA